MTASNEGRPKIHLLQEVISSDNTSSVNTDQYYTMLRDLTKSLTSSKSTLSKSTSSMRSKFSIYSILENTGKILYSLSSEKARKIIAQCGMPFKYANVIKILSKAVL